MLSWLTSAKQTIASLINSVRRFLPWVIGYFAGRNSAEKDIKLESLEKENKALHEIREIRDTAERDAGFAERVRKAFQSRRK